MKTMFKPLGLAAAVAAISAGYAGIASAQERAIGGIGDLAVLPYYTVKGDFITGVHITNTSTSTQVVKLRLRRGSDSMDALDFNLILSPEDVWTGYISKNSAGAVTFNTDDSSCSAPYDPSTGTKTYTMSTLYAEGAEEGYLEVIGMGRTIDENQAIAFYAKHVSSGEGAQPMPRNCDFVVDNFAKDNRELSNGTVISDVGWRATNETRGRALASDGTTVTRANSLYTDTGDALRVSYFIRDSQAGLEMGSAAVHISDFADEAMISNQVAGLFSGDITGFDYPDLNGGLFTLQVRDKFDSIIRPLLGSDIVSNDWSNNEANGVRTDWVVTLPGQYTMLDYFYYQGQNQGWYECGQQHPDVPSTTPNLIPNCDYRDIPTTVRYDVVRDREETMGSIESGDSVVVSPSVPGQPTPSSRFEYEVNVIKWGTDSEASGVLGSDYAINADTSAYPQPYGWAALSISAADKSAIGGQQVCQASFEATGGTKITPDVAAAGQFNALLYGGNCTPITNREIPMIGFVAWERSFPSNPGANYGRIIDHAFITSS